VLTCAGSTSFTWKECVVLSKTSANDGAIQSIVVGWRWCRCVWQEERQHRGDHILRSPTLVMCSSGQRWHSGHSFFLRRFFFAAFPCFVFVLVTSARADEFWLKMRVLRPLQRGLRAAHDAVPHPICLVSCVVFEREAGPWAGDRRWRKGPCRTHGPGHHTRQYRPPL